MTKYFSLGGARFDSQPGYNVQTEVLCFCFVLPDYYTLTHIIPCLI